MRRVIPEGTYPTAGMSPQERLHYYTTTGAIERGEKVAIIGIPAPSPDTTTTSPEAQP